MHNHECAGRRARCGEAMLTVPNTMFPAALKIWRRFGETVWLVVRGVGIHDLLLQLSLGVRGTRHTAHNGQSQSRISCRVERCGVRWTKSQITNHKSQITKHNPRITQMPLVEERRARDRHENAELNQPTNVKIRTTNKQETNSRESRVSSRES